MPANRLAAETPVRALQRDRSPEGYTLLRDVGSEYRDGAESVLLEMVRSTDDLGSMNEDLHMRGSTWAEQYHLDRRRANVLRAFDVGGAGRVLEIGAGCGAVSRYLAEACPVVDALEPVPARAAVAAERMRDLPGAQVFVGELADLPEEPSYDLIVVIGVLEYVAGGSSDRAPYLEFLDQVRRRLLPGGRVLLAIENKLGVKYLAGSPEDHSDRAFDSLEDYPVGAPARTFDRRALTGLFHEVGFETSVFGAFPDYKMTRTVIAESLVDHPSSLATRLPRFPSPDWVSPRDLGPNEELLWRSLVTAGQGEQHPNSFVVLAALPGEVTSALWPAGREAIFFTTERRPGRATQTLVMNEGGRLQLTRTLLGERRDAGGPAQRVVEGPVRPGRPLDEVLAEADTAEVGRLLSAWVAMVEASADDPDGVALDLVPHNLLLQDDGTLTFVDDEWRSTAWTVPHVVARGLLWLSQRLAGVPCAWHDRPSRRALLLELARLTGVEADDQWIAEAVRREAELQTELLRFGAGHDRHDNDVARTEEELRAMLELPLVPVRYSTKDLFVERERDRQRVAELSARSEDLQHQADEFAAENAAMRARLDRLEGSLPFRVLRSCRDGIRRAAPGKTVRGRAVRQVRDAATRFRG
jgi:SAM-dependent methyltransferase